MPDLCLNCEYTITDPICASCILDEINSWSQEQRLEKRVIKKINEELGEFLEEIESFNYANFSSRNRMEESLMKCIKCKKGMHLMCAYCVIDHATQIMKNNIKNKSTLEKFQISFNI